MKLRSPWPERAISILSDLLGAFSFLTILPVRPADPEKPGRIFAFFPLVGIVIGVAVSLVASLHFLPRELSVFLALVVWVLVTGGLHLDGLADSCDGLLAVGPPERRLEIMKDPRAGSWAIVGVTLLLLGKWVAMRSLPTGMLMVSPVVGRWAIVIVFPFGQTCFNVWECLTHDVLLTCLRNKVKDMKTKKCKDAIDTAIQSAEAFSKKTCRPWMRPPKEEPSKR